MRHTITVTIEVESDSSDRRQVIDEILGFVTDIQDKTCTSCEVLPGGEEVGHKKCTLSVAYAACEGAKTEAGWAVE